MPTLDDARAWYESGDPVHGFSHILRVYHLAEQLAISEEADIVIVRAAALLHDAKGPGIGDSRLDHQEVSARFAGEVLEKEGWTENSIKAVQHCIQSHRFRGQSMKPQTIEAKVLFDADKLDAIGAIGAVRAVAYAVLAEQDIFAEPSRQFLATGKKEPREDHTPYHEFLFKLRKIKGQMQTKSGRLIAVGRHSFLVHFFNQMRSELSYEK